MPHHFRRESNDKAQRLPWHRAASNPSTYGNNVSLTATVSPAMSGGPTMAGSVTFYAAGVALGKVAVTWFPFSSEGIATLTVKSLPA